MLINLRNALMAGKKWKNPYITDGLVAMWDGEWNTSGGTHNSAATTWKDLVGNRDWTLGTSTSYEWTANSFNAKDQFAATQEFIDGNLVQTVEFCVNIKPQNPAPSGNFAFIMLGRIARGIDNTQPYYGLLYRPSILMAGRPYFSNTYSEFVDTNTSMSFPDYGRTSSNAYFNGQSRNSNGYNTLDYNSTTRGTVARIGGTARKSMPIEVYNIRLYSRALTADEIARNYAIDKARFGLP